MCSSLPKMLLCVLFKRPYNAIQPEKEDNEALRESFKENGRNGRNPTQIQKESKEVATVQHNLKNEMSVVWIFEENKRRQLR